jgi:hypothetical protein
LHRPDCRLCEVERIFAGTIEDHVGGRHSVDEQVSPVDPGDTDIEGHIDERDLRHHRAGLWIEVKYHRLPHGRPGQRSCQQGRKRYCLQPTPRFIDPLILHTLSSSV